MIGSGKTMAQSDVDPFYTVRENVNSQIERIKSRQGKFQQLAKSVDTSVNNEFKDLKKSISKEMRAVDKDIKGLRGAIEMIENNRNKFPHITDVELDNRKNFVQTALNTLAEMKESMESVAIRKKMDDDAKQYEMASKLDNSDAGNEKFVNQSKQTTMKLIEQQDQNLEQLGVAVDRLGAIGKEINEEVREQSVLLDSLGNEIDDAADRMNVVQAALAKLLKTQDGCKIWTIVILTLILVLLIALVIWT